jgi:protein gp37
VGDKTGISWTDATWNPTRGCRRTAPAGSKQSGCGDATGGGCYAERQAARFCGKGQAYEGLITLTAKGPRWNGATKFVVEHLADPLRWKRPRRIFVDSMSDLFYEGFTNEQIAAVFGVMATCPRHTFQILTKRARRMREWFAWLDEAADPHPPRAELCGIMSVNHGVDVDSAGLPDVWPLPNVHLGVSVENQAAADERIPDLFAVPTAVRFLSVEPLLGPVDLSPYLIDDLHRMGRAARGIEIDQVIAGCESGPRSRPCEVAWLRSIRDQVAAAGKAFFLKQALDQPRDACQRVTAEGLVPVVAAGAGSKRKPGGVIELPYLDGVQHAAFPEVHRG